MNIPLSLTSGDSASWVDCAWTDASGVRHTSADWALKYEIRGPAQVTLNAVADGDGWKTTLSIADSATLTPGTYIWGAYLSKTGERITVGSGNLVVAADLSTINTPQDVRSVAEKALADCEAALANFSATGGKIKRYMIQGRETEFQTLADLTKVLQYWKIRVRNERAALSIQNGNGDPRKLLVRF